MAKRRHDENTDSKTPLIVMTAGGLAVAGLVAWALTRTVEPTPAPISGGTPTAAVGQTSPTETAPFPAGQTTAQGELPTHEERTHVPRISVEDAYAKFNRGEITIVDVRDEASYASGHIKGAINIPFASVEARIGELPRGKQVVTYCT
jgi:3-mercaptopyruvate sulfurtransferase SseA